MSCLQTEAMAERLGVTVSYRYDLLKIAERVRRCVGYMMPTAKKGKVLDFVRVKRKNADD